MKKITTDILILGGGLAGMTAAIEAGKLGRDVTLLTKEQFGKSGASYVTRAGFSVVLQPHGPDTRRAHGMDTLKSGVGINNRKLVKIMVEKAPQYLHRLEKYGVVFDKTGKKKRQYLGGGHSYPRMVYTVHKNGKDITIPLAQYISKHTKVNTVEKTMILDVFHKDDWFIAVCFRRNSGTIVLIFSRTLILASEGAGQIYKITRNPLSATGDGFAVAYLLGAELVDMEFVQHYPLEVLWPRGKSLNADIAASLPSLGAVARNKQGEAFMRLYDPRGDLATRDVHARALFQEIQEGNGVRGGVWLDLSNVSKKDLRSTIPDYYSYFLQKKIPRKRWRVIVAPGAHYFMGGVKINEHTETSIQGLFACGEVAGGIQGANRLACNSLPDCMVFGHIAGAQAALYLHSKKKARDGTPSPFNTAQYLGKIEKKIVARRSDIESRMKMLQDLMWEHAGMIRTQGGLKRVLEFITDELGHLKDLRVPQKQKLPRFFEYRNMLLTALLVCRSSAKRKESRGAHYRTDYPTLNAKYNKSFVVRKKRKEGSVRFM